ncbi:MAG: hypothetical protein M1837_007467 [Sclerophora amabilis]|nr:MAG: hypothetical protein M1837_007467 [Sclerophora amabilis]
MAEGTQNQRTPTRSLGNEDRLPDPPQIEGHDSFASIVTKLSPYFIQAIDNVRTFEQLQKKSYGRNLDPLVEYLSEEVHHTAVVAALLALKWHFASLDDDNKGVNESRGYACEVVAWRFLSFLTEWETVDYLLYEIQVDYASSQGSRSPPSEAENGNQPASNGVDDEESPLLPKQRPKALGRPELTRSTSQFGEYQGESAEPDMGKDDPMASFHGLNALEIAAISNAKKFLCQKSVQRILNGIWNGKIVFWESMSVHTKKRPHIYNNRTADPYTRLRVPKYQKAYEVLFFAIFLGLYYGVLIDRNPFHITPVEVFLYIWIAGFAYGEFSDIRDAGTLFYATDFWSLWDLGIVAIGVAYLITRVVGLTRDSEHTKRVALDILSLEALFLVPR